MDRIRYDVAFYQPYVSALYAPASGVPPGGAENQIQMIARGLARLGIRVAVVANPAQDLPARIDGVDVIPRPAARGRGPVGRLLRAFHLWRFIARLPAATIVKRVAGFDTAFVALAARFGGARFVYSTASIAEFEWSRVESRHKAALFEVGLRLADSIVVQNDEQRALCLERFGREPMVIRSIAEPAPARTEDPQFFLWVGRLLAYKRPLAFVELARALPEARFRMVTVLTGDHDPDLHAALVRAERELDNLTVLESRPRAELLGLIDSAAAVVNTSRFEGLSNLFLEAWARGVPVLSLSYDPDGAIERERLGGFAHGSMPTLARLAASMWEPGGVDGYVERCREYVAREHSPNAVAVRWARTLGLPGAERVAR